MKKSLTIEDLKNRVGKPIFVVGLIYDTKNWKILRNIGFGGTNTIGFTDKSAIEFEYQNRFRFFDTEVTALELKEILDAEEKAKKKTGYERVEKGKDYYTITSAKDVAGMREYGSFNANNEKRYKNGNHFNDETLCENIARAETLKYQLRRYAALNGGIPSQADWENSHVAKYEIIGESDNFIHATKNFESRAVGAIYFKNKEACEKAMEIFKHELLWYFTEFQEQLY